MTERRRGTVRTFGRAYGFIRDDADPETDVFFHWTRVDHRPETTVSSQMRPGVRVSFDVLDTPKGPQAVDVAVLDDEAPRSTPALHRRPFGEAEYQRREIAHVRRPGEW
jgi:cold shock CspA family protein